MMASRAFLVLVIAGFAIGLDIPAANYNPANPQRDPELRSRTAESEANFGSEVVAAEPNRDAPAPFPQYRYRLLATTKTSTMEKEMNEAAAEGYRFEAVMGGETSFGGSEVVLVMAKEAEAQELGRYEYRLLATSKTSTMQEELQTAADSGFEYMGQTVFDTTFGGDEVVVILQKDSRKTVRRHQYRLLATKKTGTMQKELSEAGEQGFELVGLTVSTTKFGGNELVSILRREHEDGRGAVAKSR